jgi:hypothetical protein
VSRVGEGMCRSVSILLEVDGFDRSDKKLSTLSMVACIAANCVAMPSICCCCFTYMYSREPVSADEVVDVEVDDCASR